MLFSFVFFLVFQLCFGLGSYPALDANNIDQYADLYDVDGMKYRLFKPPGFDNPSLKFPMVIFFHGLGEVGTDGHRQITVQEAPLRLADQDVNPTYFLAPQIPNSNWYTGSSKTITFIEQELLPNFNIDEERLYVTGLSLGGAATWKVLVDRPAMFAACATMCGISGSLENTDKIRHVPQRFYHAKNDPTVSWGISDLKYRALKSRAADDVDLISYDTGGHGGGWNKGYAEPELYSWMFAQRRKPASAIPVPPVTLYKDTRMCFQSTTWSGSSCFRNSTSPGWWSKSWEEGDQTRIWESVSLAHQAANAPRPATLWFWFKLNRAGQYRVQLRWGTAVSLPVYASQLDVTVQHEQGQFTTQVNPQQDGLNAWWTAGSFQFEGGGKQYFIELTLPAGETGGLGVDAARIQPICNIQTNCVGGTCTVPGGVVDEGACSLISTTLAPTPPTVPPPPPAPSPPAPAPTHSPAPTPLAKRLVYHLPLDDDVPSSSGVARNRAPGSTLPDALISQTGVTTDTAVPDPLSAGAAGATAAMRFSGTGSNVDFTAAMTGVPAGTSARSFSVWMRADDPSTGGYQFALGFGRSALGQAAIIGRQGRVLVGGGFGSAADLRVANTIPSDSEQWLLATVTYDGTTATLYADGQQVAQQDFVWDLVPDLGFVGQQCFPATRTNPEHWIGSIADVRIWAGALTPVEVARLHSGANALTLAPSPVPTLPVTPAPTSVGETLAPSPSTSAVDDNGQINEGTATDMIPLIAGAVGGGMLLLLLLLVVVVLLVKKNRRRRSGRSSRTAGMELSSSAAASGPGTSRSRSSSKYANNGRSRSNSSSGNRSGRHSRRRSLAYSSSAASFSPGAGAAGAGPSFNGYSTGQPSMNMNSALSEVVRQRGPPPPPPASTGGVSYESLPPSTVGSTQYESFSPTAYTGAYVQTPSAPSPTYTTIPFKNM